MTKREIEEKAKKEEKVFLYVVDEDLNDYNGEDIGTWRDVYSTDANFAISSVDERGNKKDLGEIPDKENIPDDTEVEVVEEREKIKLEEFHRVKHRSRFEVFTCADCGKTFVSKTGWKTKNLIYLCDECMQKRREKEGK